MLSSTIRLVVLVSTLFGHECSLIRSKFPPPMELIKFISEIQGTKANETIIRRYGVLIFFFFEKKSIQRA
jgi:hypothetical protein